MSKILKLCAALSAVQGRHSCFIETIGASGTGKSHEDKLVLSCFQREDVVYLNDATFASLFARDANNMHRKIIMLGDLGNTHFCRLERVFNVLKILCTEHKYTRILQHGKQAVEQTLQSEALCIIYESTKRFVRDEQIMSRTCCFSTKRSDDELLDLFVAERRNNVVDVFVAEYKRKVDILKHREVHVEHDFLASFASEVKRVCCSNKVRKLEQVLSLFESFVQLEHVDELSAEQNTLVATRADYNNFVALLQECNYMSSSVEKDFVALLKTVIEPIDLDEFVEVEFKLVDLHEKLFSKLYRSYGMYSRSKLYTGRNIFFSTHSARKVFKTYAAWRNVDDVDEMCSHLVKAGVLGVLGKFRGSNVYYIIRDGKCL